MNFERKLIRQLWMKVRRDEMRRVRKSDGGLRLNRKDFRKENKGSNFIDYLYFASLARRPA